MRSSSDSGLAPGPTDSAQAEHKKHHRGCRQNSLFIVGIGPGSMDHLSKRAMDVLAGVDAVAGYTTYIELIRPLIEGKMIISTPMTKEVERVEAAIETALDGKTCAVVSSGDPGVYAMAGLVFEMCNRKNIYVVSPGDSPEMKRDSRNLLIEVVPGIPALCSGAALLGAPLTHDFAAISLSDLLTTWEQIEQRLQAAAKADFVIVLYNPKSKKRDWQLKKAQEIILNYRDPHTPVGIVARAMREGQKVQIVPLKDLHKEDVDMQTTVFIGSSASVTYLNYMVTPRGYSNKYNLKPA